MEAGELGKTYRDGEIIIQEGESGDRMYVIQSGRAAVSRRLNNQDVFIAELGKQDVFGEMALFERDKRSATVRAIGPVRVLSVDKKTFLRRVHEDPSLAYRILQQMSQRIRETDHALAQLRLPAEGDKAGDLQPVPRRASGLRKRVEFLKYFLAAFRRTRKTAPVAPSARASAPKTAAAAHAAREGQRERGGSDRRAADRRKTNRRADSRRQGERRERGGGGS